MKKIIVGVLVLLTINNVLGSGLPESVKIASKSLAFDQFVDWMKPGPFYRISNVEVSDIKTVSGEDAVNVIIHFDDTLGCDKRKLDAQCLPVADKERLFCEIRLTDCEANGKRSVNKSFPLK